MVNNKISRKIVFLFLIWSIGLGGFAAFNVGSIGNMSNASNDKSYVLECLENSPVQYNLSEYEVFTGPSISLDGFTWWRVIIDDTNASYSWDHYVATYDWCTGSGTEQDPYVIEKLYIDAEGFGGCIGVYRSGEKYFIIRDCWLENGGNAEYNSGVFVYQAANGQILNNVIIDVLKGVFLQEDCFDTMVADNIIISDYRIGSRAILVYWATGSTFYNNKMLDFYHDIRFSESDNLTIDSNYLERKVGEIYEGNSALRLANVDYSQVVHNIFAGKLATETIKVTQIDSSNNVIVNNYATTDWSLRVDFNITIASSSGPQMAQVDFDTIQLDGSDHNYIAYNAVLLEGGGIPGYEPVLLIGILSTISIISIILLKKKVRH